MVCFVEVPQGASTARILLPGSLADLDLLKHVVVAGPITKGLEPLRHSVSNALERRPQRLQRTVNSLLFFMLPRLTLMAAMATATAIQSSSADPRCLEIWDNSCSATHTSMHGQRACGTQYTIGALRCGIGKVFTYLNTAVMV